MAWAWWKLYGFPLDPRLWAAFFLHDLGYWGKPNMDGPEGETHVEWAAHVMTALFDPMPERSNLREFIMLPGPSLLDLTPIGPWGQLCLFHSRFYAKKLERPFSRLCVADKLAVTLEPWWLYLPRVKLSGEIHEYMQLAGMRTKAGEPRNKYMTEQLGDGTARGWFNGMTTYCRHWAYQHADGRHDTWTPDQKRGQTE